MYPDRLHAGRRDRHGNSAMGRAVTVWTVLTVRTVCSLECYRVYYMV